jgi:hypothetical protein
MSTLALVLIVLLLLGAFGSLPNWGWHSYGAYPSGILGVVLLIVIVLLATGRI